MSAPYKYFAFISYSRKDSKAAAWLQKRLHWFRFPVKLVPQDRLPPHPCYLRRIFRDTTDLEVTDEHYWKNIRRALEESHYLIVVCSPNSASPRPGAANHPVDMEVDHFLKSHGGDASLVVPIILAGSVTGIGAEAALCPTLRTLGAALTSRNLPSMLPDGNTTEKDVWDEAFVALVSYLLRVDRKAIGDDIQRETERQTRVRHRWVLAIVTLVGIAALGIRFAIHESLEATRQRTAQIKLLREESENYYRRAIREALDGNREASLVSFYKSLVKQAQNETALASGAAHLAGVDRPVWWLRHSHSVGSTIHCADFDPTGELLAIGGTASEGSPSHAEVVRPSSGKKTGSIDSSATIAAVKISRNGQLVAVGSDDNKIKVFEATSGTVILDYKCSGRVASVDLHPNMAWIAAGGWDRIARVLEFPSGRERCAIECSEPVTSAKFSLDGHWAAFGGRDKKVRVINLSTNALAVTLDSDRIVTCIEFDPDSRLLAIGGNGGEMAVFDTSTWIKKINLNLKSSINAIKFTPDGTLVCAACGEFGEAQTAKLSVWDVKTNKITFEVGFNDVVECVSVSPDGRWVAAGGVGHTVKVIALDTGRVLQQLSFDSGVAAISFSKSGHSLTIGNTDGSLRAFEYLASTFVSSRLCDGFFSAAAFIPNKQGLLLATDKDVYHINTMEQDAMDIGLNEGGSSLAISSDGTKMAIGDLTKGVRVLALPSGELIDSVSTGIASQAMCFSLNGSKLAVGGFDSSGVGTVMVLDTSTWRSVLRTQVGKMVLGVDFVDEEGKRLAIASLRHGVRIVEVSDGHTIGELINRGASDVQYCATKKLLAYGSIDGGVSLLDPQTCSVLRVLFQGRPVKSISFSPDGKMLAVGCGEIVAPGEAWVIDVSTGNRISQVAGDEFVKSVKFSSSGQWLATTIAGKRGAEGKLRMIDCRWFNPVGESPSLSWYRVLLANAGNEFRGDGLIRESGIELQKTAMRVKAITSTEPDQAPWQNAIIQWLRCKPEMRSMSPWTTESLREVAWRWFTDGSISEAVEAAPWHPLEPVSLARLEPRPNDKIHAATRETMVIRPRFLARLTLQRLHDADETLYGRATLAEYAAWSAKIMHKELHLDSEAKEALAFALERTPAEKQKELLELKAKLGAK